MAHTVEERAADRAATGATVSPRRWIAVVSVALIALALLLVGLIGIGNLRTYQVVLDVAGALLMFFAAFMLLRGKLRWLSVLTSWLGAFGIIAEFGDFQARENDIGALAATNTSYFLPGATWILLFGVLVLAIVASMYARADKDR